MKEDIIFYSKIWLFAVIIIFLFITPILLTINYENDWIMLSEFISLYLSFSLFSLFERWAV